MTAEVGNYLKILLKHIRAIIQTDKEVYIERDREADI
jgi:hypothetical protein